MRHRAFLQLTRCMSNHRPVCRGVAPDGDGRPARAPTFARTPRSLAPCWQGARRGDNEVLEAYVNKMLNVFADAWRLQDIDFDVSTQRLQKIRARL